MREVTMNEYDKFVDFMFKNLTSEDIECINECERDNHGMYGIEFHFTVGRQIRNMFHLWELYPDADEVSAQIIHRLICRVKGEPYDL